MISKFIKSNLFKQILKFGVVGGIAFLVDYVLLFVLTEYLNVYYLISSTISFIVSLVVNYILSIYWVFDVKKKQTIKEIALFVFLSTIGLGINQVILYVGEDIFSIHYMICKLFATFVVMVYNFITRKIFIEK